MLQRYAVIQGGLITATISWDDAAPTEGLPAGVTLMLESDAVLQGIPRAVPVGKSEALARAAIQSNRANVAQDRGIAADALAIAQSTGALTNAQRDGAIRQIAGWIATLAHNDSLANRQRTALILHGLTEFDPTGANTQVASTNSVPGDAGADAPPAVFSTP